MGSLSLCPSTIIWCLSFGIVKKLLAASSKNLFNLSLDDAIELLNTKQNLGRVLGKDKKSGNEIELKRGRFGFYVTDGKINVSLKNGEDMEITLEQALEKIKVKSLKA